MPGCPWSLGYGVMLLLAGRLVVWANELPAGNYPPCDHHAELLKREHKDLGVRFSTADPELSTEFARAMDFWASILDMEWHKEDTRNCAIQIVDGSRDLFEAAQVARAQFPQVPAFQGLIAFNPKADLSGNAKYVAAVHELGHVLGLPHNSDGQSVMFYMLVDGPVSLDASDFAALAARHALRPKRMDRPLIIDASSVWIACSFANICFFAAFRHAPANTKRLIRSLERHALGRLRLHGETACREPEGHPARIELVRGRHGQTHNAIQPSKAV